jgi:hypothetical protein
MHIKESSLAMAASHQQATETRRQFLLAPIDGAAPASFDEMLERARKEAEYRMPLLTMTSEPPEASAEKRLHSLLMLLLGRDEDAEPPDAGAETEAPPGMPKLRARPMFELVHTRETERCSFSASGNICLADGSTREFDVGYEMERSEESTRVSVGTLRDPLVLDFAAPSSRLGEHSVDFDLDADGTPESMRMPDRGAAFLFHDRNGNGIADDGSELFGPTTGNGFAELAALDDDGNRWIDAGDAAYAELMLWCAADDGSTTCRSLADAGIGALSTRYEETPFTIKENGEVIGQVRGSSVWLGEESGAGIVRQIDIATTPADAEEATQPA